MTSTHAEKALLQQRGAVPTLYVGRKLLLGRVVEAAADTSEVHPCTKLSAGKPSQLNGGALHRDWQPFTTPSSGDDGLAGEAEDAFMDNCKCPTAVIPGPPNGASPWNRYAECDPSGGAHPAPARVPQPPPTRPCGMAPPGT